MQLPEKPAAGAPILAREAGEVIEALHLLQRMQGQPPIDVTWDDGGVRISLAREWFIRVVEVTETIVKGGTGRAEFCQWDAVNRHYVRPSGNGVEVEVLDAIDLGPARVGQRAFIAPGVASGMWELLDYGCG